jgi:hypothetical protein
MFVTFEALGEELQIFLELQKQRNNVWGFDLVWVLMCSLACLSTHSVLPSLAVFFCFGRDFWKEYTKVGTFWGKNSSQKSPFFTQWEFLHVARTRHDSRKFGVSILTSSQIWLIPLVDNGQSTYLTKLKKQTLIPVEHISKKYKILKISTFLRKSTLRFDSQRTRMNCLVTYKI